MKDRVLRDFSADDIRKVSETFHAWRRGSGYADEPGFCKAARLEDIKKHDYMLSPGRYVGSDVIEDDGEPFAEKMQRLIATLRKQQGESAELDAAIAANLKELGYGR